MDLQPTVKKLNDLLRSTQKAHKEVDNLASELEKLKEEYSKLDLDYFILVDLFGKEDQLVEMFSILRILMVMGDLNYIWCDNNLQLRGFGFTRKEFLEILCDLTKNFDGIHGTIQAFEFTEKYQLNYNEGDESLEVIIV